MAKNVRVTWDLPTTRESGNELPRGEIAHTIASISLSGSAVFTEMNRFIPSQEQLLFLPDTDTGVWLVRLTVVDTDGRQSKNADVEFTVPDESAPGTVVNVAVTMD